MNDVLALPMTVPVPLAVGSLDAYVRTVSRFPVLSAEEEQRFARRFRAEGDLDGARQLILSHLRLVVAVARGYLGYGLPHADLIQEGNIGLMKAVKRFDPERGVRLVSFAIHWIKAEIHEYILRNWRLIKVATTKAQRKLFFNLRSMKQGFAPMSSQEIGRVARELKVKPEEVVEMETRLAGRDVAFENENHDETGYAPVHYLATDADAEPSRVLEAEEDERLQSDGLKRALVSLDPRSRRIIAARWLKEKDAATLHELAAEFKVSAERIRQIEAKAMEKMRKLLAAPSPRQRVLPGAAAH
ncbi:MAG: RNA polymerase factor sigma-32 [Betaproteobacteria bacterium RIFCSPLOWO2_02_FULL_66_14]|nr:MAG: RNA polymerase factor sigma-32 [Betaproteobacteria bacterium RIFCSPLOWO2_02_FULL_66_14]